MVSVVIVLLACLVGISSSSVAQAASTGYVNLQDWAVAGQTATATLPGTRAADGNVTYQQSAGGEAPTISTAQTGTWPGALISTPNAAILDNNSTCLDGLSAQWSARDCFTRTATVTFPQPVVDPEMVIGLGGRSSAPDDKSFCHASWENVTFSAVNGAAPAATAVEATSVGARSQFANGTLSLPDQEVKTLSDCVAPNTSSSIIRVRGLVSSVTLTYTFRAIITKADGRSTGWALGGTGGVYMQVAVPSVDLAVTKSGPAQVAHNGGLTWQIGVTNNGGGDSHGFVVKDAVPAGVSSPKLESAPAGCTLIGSDLVCTRSPDACSVAEDTTQSAVARLTCGRSYLDADAVVLAAGETFGPIVLSGVATSAVGTTIVNTATVAGVDSDPIVANNSSTATSSVLAALAVYKDFPADRRRASDQVTLTAEANAKVLGSATTTGDDTGLQDQHVTEFVSVPVPVGTTVTISEAMAPGSESSMDAYVGSWECSYLAGANRTTVASGSGSRGTFTFPATLPGGVSQVSCVFSNTPRSWNLAKTATTNGAAPEERQVSPGDVIDYTVTATNTGAGDVDNVVLTDDLSDVLDDATFVAGSAKLTIGDGAPTSVGGPTDATLTTAAFTLPQGQKATLTYSVKVTNDAWLAELTNTVSGTGGAGGAVPPSDCYQGQSPLAAQCSTTNRTNASIEIEKVGQSGDARIDGSAFELLADADGQPGAALAQYPVVRREPGLFSVTNLPVGTYWLRETQAPTGFSLLAQPVQFTVSATGEIRIGQNADGVVSADSARITVRDYPTSRLPAAGGTGIAPFALAGAALLASAGVVVLRRRSTHSATHR